MISRPLCPIRAFRLQISDNTPAGDPIFPNMARANVSHISIRSFSRADIADGALPPPPLLPPRGGQRYLRLMLDFRIAHAGGWAPGKYRAYLELHHAEELQIHSISHRLNLDRPPVRTNRIAMSPPGVFLCHILRTVLFIGFPDFPVAYIRYGSWLFRRIPFEKSGLLKETNGFLTTN